MEENEIVDENPELLTASPLPDDDEEQAAGQPQTPDSQPVLDHSVPEGE